MSFFSSFRKIPGLREFRRMLVLIPVLAFCLVSSSLGQGMAPAAPVSIDAETKSAIIDSVTETLNMMYIFPDVAEKMEKHLRKQMKRGEYDDIVSLREFTGKLTEDLFSICGDKHLGIYSFPPEFFENRDTLSEAEEQLSYLEESQYENFGFNKIERLPGNIGYLRFDHFEDAAIGGETAVAAMNFLQYSDALIIDLRYNRGGNASMIKLLSSYFFEDETHLNDFYYRESDQTEQSWTQSHVEGKKLLKQPIYVLTSSGTFSAAEEFTYNLKNLERATIVGETTGGGAHPITRVEFPSLLTAIVVPHARAVNPITGTNWEGAGVGPHIAVPADEALEAAQIAALKQLIPATEDEGRKQAAEWALTGLETMGHPVKLTVKEMSDFTGDYGPRKIFTKDGRLYYQREGRPVYKMIPMGEDKFMLEDLERFRIRFERDENGKVTILNGLYNDGHRDFNQRTGR